jgi:endonuclease III
LKKATVRSAKGGGKQRGTLRVIAAKALKALSSAVASKPAKASKTSKVSKAKASKTSKVSRASKISKVSKVSRAAASVRAGRGVASEARPKAAQAPRRARAPRLRADPTAVLERLSLAISHPHVELVFDGDPWKLLVAVILSAQSTDRRVNQVTPEVFRRWPTPAALAEAATSEVEEVIKSTGFFRNKTKAIVGASRMLVERFGGEVPRQIDDLVDVPGVARKTANVVLGAAYGVASGIVVDTHAARVAQRLVLTVEVAPEKIERDLCAAFPRERWLGMSHRLVLHGRYVCTARAPQCLDCPLNELCPSRVAPGEGEWTERAAHENQDMDRRAEGFTRVGGG